MVSAADNRRYKYSGLNKEEIIFFSHNRKSGNKQLLLMFQQTTLVRAPLYFSWIFLHACHSQDGWLSSRLQIHIQGREMVVLCIFYPRRQSLPLSRWLTFICIALARTAMDTGKWEYSASPTVEMTRKKGVRLSIRFANEQNSEWELGLFHCFYNIPLSYIKIRETKGIKNTGLLEQNSSASFAIIHF